MAMVKISGRILVMLRTGLSDFGKKSSDRAGGNCYFLKFGWKGVGEADRYPDVSLVS
jgi:hypothetical protein